MQIKFKSIDSSMERSMIRAAVAFFILALVAVLFGAYGIAGLSIEVAKVLLMVFLALAILSYVGSIVTGKKSHFP